MNCVRDACVRLQRFPGIFLSFVLFLMLVTPDARAVPARAEAYLETQPDGSTIRLRMRGDERHHWSEDLDGYAVIQAKGWFEYARLNPEGRLVPTGLKVGQDDPRAGGLSPHVKPGRPQRAPGGGANTIPDSPDAPLIAPYGTIQNLVVLVQFSNHQGRALPTPGEIDVLFNAVGGHAQLAPTGSVRDLYLQNSYGQLELDSDVSGWITVSNTEQYYANGNSGDSTLWEALREALTELDRDVDFTRYDSNGDGFIDSIAFLHSGYGAEWGGGDADGTASADRIWSHRWAIQDPVWVSDEGVAVSSYHISPALWGRFGSEIGRIGVIAHETGHFFGLPDLYDIDGGGEGIGSFGLMGNPWGFDSSQLCPPHLSPWSKMQLGWIDPVEISQPGKYAIGQSETDNEYFVVSAGYAAGEYLIIENRQNAGFDCSLPQGGLAIWHIDEQAGFYSEGYPGKRWPRDGKHYRVALAQADGDFFLEKGYNRGDAGDLHHAGGVDAFAPGPDVHPNSDGYQGGQITVTGHVISRISAAGPDMFFCLNGCENGDGTTQPPGGFGAPTTLSAVVSTSGGGKNALKWVDLSWVDNSSGADNEDLFVIERCEETGRGKSKVCDYAEHAIVGQDIRSFHESPGSGTYRYRVKARRGSDDDTAYSNEVEA